MGPSVVVAVGHYCSALLPTVFFFSLSVFVCLSSGVGVRERREVPLSLRRADDQTSSGGTESIRPFFPFSPSSLSTVFLFSKVLREAHGALEPIHTCMRARQARQMEEERKWRKQAEMTSTFFLFFIFPLATTG